MPLKPEKTFRNRLTLRSTRGEAMLQNNADEKAGIYEDVSSMNKAFAEIVQHLHTLIPSKKPGCSNQNLQNCSRVLLLNCKPNSTRNFSKTCIRLSLTIGVDTAKPARNGKSIFVILTTFSFTPKNAKNSLPNNAREQRSRKSCKTGRRSQITLKGISRCLFLCV